MPSKQSDNFAALLQLTSTYGVFNARRTCAVLVLDVEFSLILSEAHQKERYKEINASEKHMLKRKMDERRVKPRYKHPTL